jgi:hypothetical protein
VNYLGDNKDYDDEGVWDVIEVSKVNDKIIKRLLTYLTDNISENFFISFESVLKLIDKIPDFEIKFILKELDKSNDYKKELFQFILDFKKNNISKYHLLPHLYNPDFILRARTVMKIKENDDIDYIMFLLPLINDPDDSVRWSVIEYLSKYTRIPIIKKKLADHIDYELNPVIYKNLEKIIKI